MDLRPHAFLRPCPEPAPAGNAAAAPHFRWHLVPSGARPQHKHDACQAGPIRYSRATTFRIGLVRRKKRLNRLPKIIGNEAKCHGAFSFFSPPWLWHRHSRLLTLGVLKQPLICLTPRRKGAKNINFLGCFAWRFRTTEKQQRKSACFAS